MIDLQPIVIQLPHIKYHLALLVFSFSFTQAHSQACTGLCAEIDLSGETLGNEPCDISFAVAPVSIEYDDDEFDVTVIYNWDADGVPIGDDSPIVSIPNQTLKSTRLNCCLI